MVISQIPIARSTSGGKKPSSFSAMGAGSVQAAPGVVREGPLFTGQHSDGDCWLCGSRLVPSWDLRTEPPL